MKRVLDDSTASFWGPHRNGHVVLGKVERQDKSNGADAGENNVYNHANTCTDLKTKTNPHALFQNSVTTILLN